MEFEFKYLLREDQYFKILSKLQNNYEVKQETYIDYYFDSSKYDLFNKLCTVRVRQKGSKLKLDVKFSGSRARDGYLSSRQEFSQEIEDLPLSIDMNKLPICDQLPYRDVVHMVGVLITERNTCTVKKGLTIDLDKSSYLGVVDFELEIEFSPELEEEAFELFQALLGNLETSGIGMGKRRRFISRLCNLLGYQLT
ncbi:CYTH domain-containing protein [Brevibacillus gelatini]